MSKTIRQFIKYGMVGLLNTGVTLAVIFICTKVLHIHYLAANALGYIAGFINSFLWNRNWTFSSTAHPWVSQMVRFLMVFGVCYGIQFAFLYSLVSVLHFNEDLSQIAGMVLYTGIGFILNKLFVFSHKENEEIPS